MPSTRKASTSLRGGEEYVERCEAALLQKVHEIPNMIDVSKLPLPLLANVGQPRPLSRMLMIVFAVILWNPEWKEATLVRLQNWLCRDACIFQPFGGMQARKLAECTRIKHSPAKASRRHMQVSVGTAYRCAVSAGQAIMLLRLHT